MIQRDGHGEFTKDELDKWDTKRVMAHFDTIRAYRQHTLSLLENRREILKETEFSLSLFDNYMKELKDVLSTREHIPNKQESKVIRQEKAKAKRNR
jgi:hypothetical protein